ncbi:DUF732 domain-containing protein [Nocardia blacklockiae]|uniref:DUF732 domain-containing protein n=1 Tax=Nocardia blacklockiae TaxID=480036 RepID=UPI0018942435|nr:DUF732 domain-containing protein [Nocardia blacklockiae]MBF6173471.1 DUF732 domain-containing protein [Nocardia blacklockiae]
MLRTRGKVTGVVVSLAAVGLLAACGDNDSTATSTPTLKTSTTAAAGPTIPSVVQVPPAESAQPSAEPSTSAAERPEPAQPPAASGNTAELSDKDQGLIDELKKRGLNPTPDIAVTTASFVCQGKSSGLPDDQIATYVNAMAGSDPNFDPQKMSVEQAGRIYIDTANQAYCNK